MNYKIRLTFTEPLLGTVPMDKEVYSNYILDKKADLNGEGDELETIRDDKGKTGFHMDGNTPIIYDYVIKGFMKDACGMMRRVDKSASSKVTAFKKIIDGLVFVTPRRIPIVTEGPIGVLERPLRAQTAQGERVALAYSEMIPTGSALEFELIVLDDGTVNEALIKEWLNYGALRGLGQWRNGSYGRFKADIAKA